MSYLVSINKDLSKLFKPDLSIIKMTTMKALTLFGLKFFEEDRALKFRYTVFLNQLKPKIYFEKELRQFETINLDEGLTPKVSSRPDMVFINTVVSRLLKYFEGLTYEETKNAIIYEKNEKGVCMLSKATLMPVMSKGITPKKVTKLDTMPEQMVLVLDSVVQQILNYYMMHWSHVLMYYYWLRRS